MIVIGITGGSGSGKSTVGKLFETYGGKSADADKIYHKLLCESSVMRREILARFPEAEDSEGNINRKKLASIVFTDDKSLYDLNAITHKYVIAEIEAIIGEYYRCNLPLAMIDAIALFESGANELCDVTVGVIASTDVRIARIKERDDLDENRARARINAQPNDEYYIRKCDYVIENSGETPPDQEVERVYRSIMGEMESNIDE